MDSTIKKVYDIRLLGADAVLKNMQSVNSEFDRAKKVVQALQQAALKNANLIVDPEKIKQEKAVLEEAERALLKATAAKKQADADSKAIDAYNKVQATERKKQTSDIQAEAGSYNQLAAQLKLAKAELKNISIGTKGFDEALLKVQSLQEKINSFNRSLSRDGLLVGEYSSGIIQAFQKLGLGDLITGQIDQTKNKIRELEDRQKVLRTEYDKVKQTGVGSFKDIEKELILNITETNELKAALVKTETGFKGIGSIGAQISNSLNNQFKGLRTNVTQLLIGYVGFQQAFTGLRSAIRLNEELGDKFIDLQRIMGVTKQKTDAVIESLKNINTRTSLNSLVDFATIAAKAGVASEDIAGVTKAIDQLQLVAGKELGSVEKTTESLVKLINVFEGPGKTTEQNVLRYGNALVELANKGVATGDFLVDFAQRLAGIQGVTKIQIQSVLGLAAAFQETGQSAEVSASAVTQLLNKIGNDVPKYAALAKLSEETFRKLLRENPAEALLSLAQNLKGNSKAFDEISSKFSDLEARGVRVTSIFGVMADKTDFFREKIGIASAALQNTGAIIDGAAQKQQTFAATVDRIKKSFELLGSSTALQQLFSAIANSLLFLIKIITAIPFSVIITGLGLATAAWAYYKGNVISATLAQKYNSDATLLGTIRKAAERLGLISSTTAKAADTVATTALTTATKGATTATTAFNTAVKASPLGIILALIGLLIPVMSAFGETTKKTTHSIDDQNKSLQNNIAIQSELNKQVSADIASTKSKIDSLIAILKDENAALYIRKKAYDELIKIAPEFAGTLDAEYRATEKLNSVYDRYIKNLKEASRAKAVGSIRDKYAQDEAEKENEAFQAKLRADEEKASNKRIEAQNDKARKDNIVINANVTGGSMFGTTQGQDYVKLLPTSNEAQKAYQKALVEARKTKEVSDNFDQFVKTDINEKQKNIDDKLKQLDKLKKGSDEYKKLKTEIEDDQKNLLLYIGGGNNIPTPDNSITPPADEKNSKGKTAEQIRDERINRLKQQEDTLKKQLEVAYKETDKTKKIFNGQEINNEETYLRQLNKITQDYADKKLAVVNAASKQEQNRIAEFNLDKINAAADTDQKIYQLKEKAYKQNYDFLKKQAEDESGRVQDSDAPQYKKLQATLNYNKTLKKITEDFYTKEIEAAKLHNQQTKQLEQDKATTLLQIERDITKTQKQLQKQRFDDEINNIKNVGYYRKAALENEANTKKLEILNNTKLSQKEKDIALQKLQGELSLKTLNAEIEAVKKQITAYQIKYGIFALFNKEYIDLLTKLNKLTVDTKQQENENKKIGKKDLAIPGLNTTQQQIKDALSESFNIKEDAQNLLGNVIAESFDIAKQSMNDYFDAERQRIELSKQATLDKLELEKNQLKDQAQSRAEQDSIDRQYENKKKLAEKQAGEQLKKVKKAELKIALATELANIAVAAASNPANAFTFGGAGIAMYAVLSALALARYALNVSNVDKQQFSRGGEVPKSGGEFKGNSHNNGGTSFIFQGRAFEAEAKELAIINKKSAQDNKVYNVSGTTKQIASLLNEIGGGQRFATGAVLHKYADGGYLGSRIQPPVFASYYSNANTAASQSQDTTELKALIANTSNNVDTVNQTLKQLQVVVRTQDINESQKKLQKQSEIATL